MNVFPSCANECPGVMVLGRMMTSKKSYRKKINDFVRTHNNEFSLPSTLFLPPHGQILLVPKTSLEQRGRPKLQFRSKELLNPRRP